MIHDCIYLLTMYKGIMFFNWLYKYHVFMCCIGSIIVCVGMCVCKYLYGSVYVHLHVNMCIDISICI